MYENARSARFVDLESSDGGNACYLKSSTRASSNSNATLPLGVGTWAVAESTCPFKDKAGFTPVFACFEFNSQTRLLHQADSFLLLLRRSQLDDNGLQGRIS